MNVSIITPMFHGNTYIKRLSEVIKNTAICSPAHRIEWVIVNDLPGSKIQLPRISEKNLTIRYIKNKRNLGIQKSRIVGINRSSSEYILLLDQDDFIDSNAINKCLKVIEDKDACVMNGTNEDPDGTMTPLFVNTRQMRFTRDIKYYFYIGNLIASPGMVLIKKSSIPQKWLDNPIQINGADDWLLWVMMLANKSRFEILNENLYIHKKNVNNTSDNNKLMLSSSQEAMYIFQKEYAEYSGLVNIYKRRLEMREKYEEDGYNKFLEYLLNPDIALRLLVLKFSSHFSN